MIWAIYLPLMIVAAFLLINTVLNFSNYQIHDSTSVHLAAILMIVNSFLVTIQRFPEGILFGSNIIYKSTPIKIVILITSGAFSYLSITMGYGVYGLAIVQILTTVALIILYSLFTRFHISWLAIKRPDTQTFLRNLKRGFWFFLWALVNFGMLQMELLLLGIFTNDLDLVGKFAITIFAIQMILVFVSSFVAAALPGFGNLIGKEKFSTVSSLRVESIRLSWLLAISLSLTLLVINESFINLIK